MQLNEAGILAKSDMQNLARSQGVVAELRSNDDIDADLDEENQQTDQIIPQTLTNKPEGVI